MRKLILSTILILQILQCAVYANISACEKPTKFKFKTKLTSSGPTLNIDQQIAAYGLVWRWAGYNESVSYSHGDSAPTATGMNPPSSITLTQNVVASQPTWNTNVQNGKPGLSFGRTAYHMERDLFPCTLFATGNTIVLVYKKKGNAVTVHEFINTRSLTGTGTNGIEMYFNTSSQKITLDVRIATKTAGNWTWPKLNDTNAHILVIAYDGSSTANTPNCWIDGTKLSLTTVTTPGGAMNAQKSMILGSYASTSGCHAVILDYAIFRGKLTDDKVGELNVLFNNNIYSIY